MAFRDMLLGKRDTPGFAPMTPAHRTRAALMAQFWNYYRGHHKRHLKMTGEGANDNVTLNYSKRVVNKGVQALFGKEVRFDVDGDGNERSPAEKWLDQVWGSVEEKQMLLQKLAQNGGVTGTAVLRIMPPTPGVADGLPRLVNVDPAILDILTNPDDIEDIRAYHLIWKSGDVWKRHNIALQEDGNWLVSEEHEQAGKWIVDQDIDWPWPFAPILHCQNLPLANELWGMSDLEEADINDALNFNGSNVNRIIRFHAHPKTIGTGFQASQVQSTAVDQMWTIPSETAKVQNLEMQSDLASSREWMADLRNTYSKVTNVPELDPAQVNVGALSGFALRILYGDLLEATNTKRNTYGALLNELNARLVALGNQGAYGDVKPKCTWQDALPSNELEQAQVLEIDRRNGLSQETYLTKRGYNAQDEIERNQQAQERQGTLGENLLMAFERGNQTGMPQGNRNGQPPQNMRQAMREVANAAPRP